MRVLGVIFIVLMSAIGANAQTKNFSGKVSLMHWWISDAESAALNVIVEAADARGIDVQLIPISNHSKAREVLSDLLRIGQQPQFAQWIASGDTNALVNSSELVLTWPDLSQSVVPELRDLLSVNGTMGAIPIVTHIQNAMFVNTEILDAHGLGVPQSWPDLLEAAEMLQKNGIQPILTSAEPWQVRMLFNDILLAVGGLENYRAFYNIEKSDALEDAIRNSFEMLFRVREMQKPDQPEYWAEIARRFADGDAAFLFLGDFAWAEIVRAPDVKIESFGCTNAPGTDGVLVYGTDIFIGFASENPQMRTAQQKLGEILLDPSVQRDFVAIKGGMPVITGLSAEELAPCARYAYQQWGEETTQVLPTPWSFNRIALNFLEKALAAVWADPSITAAEATDALLQNLYAVSIPVLEPAE